MSQYDYDDEFNNDNEAQPQDNLPNPARKHLREMEKKVKELETALQAKDSDLVGYRVRDVLTQRGITDERASRWLQRDVQDLSDSAAVAKWLDENGSLFGAALADSSSADQDEARQAYQKMAQTEARGLPAGNSEDELIAGIKNQQTPEALTAFLKTKGF